MALPYSSGHPIGYIKLEGAYNFGAWVVDLKCAAIDAGVTEYVFGPVPDISPPTSSGSSENGFTFAEQGQLQQYERHLKKNRRARLLVLSSVRSHLFPLIRDTVIAAQAFHRLHDLLGQSKRTVEAASLKGIDPKDIPYQTLDLDKTIHHYLAYMYDQRAMHRQVCKKSNDLF